MCFNSFSQHVIVVRLPDPEDLDLEENEPPALRIDATWYDVSRFLMGRTRSRLSFNVEQ